MTFRSPVPEYLELLNTAHRWHDRSIDSDCLSDGFSLPKQSHCSLEVDVRAQDILNRLDVKGRPLHQDFSEFLQPATLLEEKLVPSMASLWKDETRRRKQRQGIIDDHSSPFGPEELVSMSAGSRDSGSVGWFHEEEYRQAVLRMASSGDCRGESPSFTNFVCVKPFEEQVKTACDSVCDFFREEPRSEAPRHDYGNAEVHVDRQAALSFDSNEQSDDNYFSNGFDNSDETSDFAGRPGDVNFDSLQASLPKMEADPAESTVRKEIPLRPSQRDSTLDLAKRPQQEGSGDLPTPKRAKNNGHVDGQEDSKLYRQNDSRHHTSGRQTRTLDYPVVKDPRNSMTVMRFSQDRSRSSKATPDNLQVLHKPHSLVAGDIPGSTSEREASSQVQSSALESDTINARVFELAAEIRPSFSIRADSCMYCFRQPGPTSSEVSSTIGRDGRPSVIYQKAFYSNEEDVPERQSEYAGREIQVQGNTIHSLPDFDKHGRLPAMFEGTRAVPPGRRDWQQKLDQRLRESSHSRVWEFAAVPPSRSEVVDWFENAQRKKDDTVQGERELGSLSQIEGPSQKSDNGLDKSASVEGQDAQYMSIMSLEVHVNTRRSLVPNPDEDEVTCVFWCLHAESGGVDSAAQMGIITHGGKREARMSETATKVDIEREPTELDLITRIVDIVRFHDPDILTGYEVHSSSWGYLIERARKMYDYDLCDEVSRVKSQAHGRFGKDADRWGFNHSSSIRITGRHMINIWRTMRSELNLLQYTAENVAFHVLKRRVPHYPFQELTAWYQSAKPRDFQKVVDYFLLRVRMDLEILTVTDLIPRTSEQARLLGVDFFSVLSRGSQFKVESLMFRIAKPENFLLVSPSRKQVGGQNALECLPLVMEPQSDFYTSPVLVLDFQSLYPSLMIAHNYCYSTFFGRVSDWRGRDKMGFTDYKRQPHLLQMLRDRINIAPNGMMYVKPEVRRSLLARMLSEILETRVMVKAGMKADKDDKVLQRLLNNKQLALKFIANVTYGYTSASFSGRMPCSEIADSIVLSGRETLEKAISLIHSVDRWNAEVVYGDTDSLFVHLKGRTREEAFDIGEEIAKAVTEANRRPIKLKFEKVYHPCVLLAKKRYVGFKYEHRDQAEPEFDAKGIETVRRDGTPAEQKIEEKAVKILFRTADLSKVKSYFQKQCAKIMQGRVSIQDFCFAKEVRLGTYSGLPPPGAMVSTRKMLQDPRSEPQYGERVPYVVITGAPGSRLVDRCVAPEFLLHDAQVGLDSEYYITKNIIPPLERIFNLVGANVRLWYDEMPKFRGFRRVHGTVTVETTSSVDTAATITGEVAPVRKRFGRTLESYMKSSSCIVCQSKRLENTDISICNDCMVQPHVSLLNIGARLQQLEKGVVDLSKVCRSCTGIPFGEPVKCDSKDCPVFYSRTRNASRWSHERTMLDPAIKLLRGLSEGDLDW